MAAAIPSELTPEQEPIWRAIDRALEDYCGPEPTKEKERAFARDLVRVSDIAVGMIEGK